jgi:hypothetical protein
MEAGIPRFAVVFLLEEVIIKTEEIVILIIIFEYLIIYLSIHIVIENTFPGRRLLFRRRWRGLRLLGLFLSNRFGRRRHDTGRFPVLIAVSF